MTRKYIERPSFVLDNLDTMKAEREKFRLTQRALSALTGIQEGNIAGYEVGYSVPSVKNYNRLAEVFGWEAWQ